MAHSASAGRLSPLGLLSPLVRTDLGSWVAARSALLLLAMEAALVAPTADRVRLGVTLTKRGRTLGHC